MDYRNFHWANIDIEKTIREFLPDKSLAEQKPTFIIICGPPAVGKTLIRRQDFSFTHVIIDAGDIFLSLTCNRSLPFPSSVLNDEMDLIGISLLLTAINEKRNVICELSMIPYEEYAPYVQMIKDIGFDVHLQWIDCDLMVALERNETRGNEFISSYYTDAFHMRWISSVYQASKYSNYDL